MIYVAPNTVSFAFDIMLNIDEAEFVETFRIVNTITGELREGTYTIIERPYFYIVRGSVGDDKFFKEGSSYFLEILNFNAQGSAPELAYRGLVFCTDNDKSSFINEGNFIENDTENDFITLD